MTVADARTTAAPAALRYFTAFESAFEDAAAAAGGSVDHDLEIGGRAIRLRYAGAGLVALTLPPLAHRLTEAAVDPEATICVWDTASTGVQPPPYPWRPRDLRERGEVDGYNDERFRTTYHGDVLTPDYGFDALSMYDAEGRTAIFWVRSADAMPRWESAQPFRSPLHWVLGGPRTHLAHAAAVGRADGAVLLAGVGGSGKSTTALACLEAGMGFVSDDYLLLSLEDGPRAHSIFCSAKLAPESLALVPGLADAVDWPDAPDGEKLVLDLFRHRHDLLLDGPPLRALVVPQVGRPGVTRLAPASAVEGLLALAPTTIYQLGHGGDALRPMADLARRVPVYRLELGGDPAAAAAAIGSLLDHGGRP